MHVDSPDDPSVVERARELCLAHLTPAMVVAKLHSEFGELTYESIDAWADVNAVQHDRWRNEGAADVLAQLKAIANGDEEARKANGNTLTVLIRLAEQHCFWAREPAADMHRKSYDKAMRERGREGLKAVKSA